VPPQFHILFFIVTEQTVTHVKFAPARDLAERSP
jgi:hypothetical protein